MKIQLSRLLLFAFYCLTYATAQSQANYTKISNYQVYYGWAHRAPDDWIILRRFSNQGRSYYMMVNPHTLITRVDETIAYPVKAMTLAELRDQFSSTPYVKAIKDAESHSVMVQDAGIERGLPKETGISLTADLCPSHRPLDRRIFTDMFAALGQVEHPVPIALSISGVWMVTHAEDLAWLKQQQKKQEIYVTWVNHSYTHRVSRTAPLKENFLLEPGTNINYEVLECEKAMLKNGLLPSVFFRFPGLVSDQQLVYRITDFGLIPIGSDAWLAKGQVPMNGSIVLIHGNGNEPIGVDDFINLLHSKTSSIAKKQWLLYDLRESVDDEFTAP